MTNVLASTTTRHALVRTFGLTLLCALVLASASCSRMSQSWKEEVRLSDGRLIVVKRTAKGTMKRDMAMRATGWEPGLITLRVPHTDGDVTPPVWRSSLIPVVMDYDRASSTWSVVATHLYCNTWYDMGRPASQYVQYISVGGETWRVVPLQPGWAGRRANLMTHIAPTGIPPIVREQYKEMLWRRGNDPYKSISTSWETNC